jgi:integrase/recombinase XerD
MSNRTSSAYAIPPARKASPLRQRMIDDMTVRNLAPNTMLCYLKQVSYLARYFGRLPERLGPEEIREYQLYLAEDRRVSVSSRLVATTALRFLYGVTLKRDRFIEMLPTPRKEHHLPVILSPGEVLRFLEAAPSFSHHVIFVLRSLASWEQQATRRNFAAVWEQSTRPKRWTFWNTRTKLPVPKSLPSGTA